VPLTTTQVYMAVLSQPLELFQQIIRRLPLREMSNLVGKLVQILESQYVSDAHPQNNQPLTFKTGM